MAIKFSRRRFVMGGSALAAGAGLWSVLGRRALAAPTGIKRVVFWYGVEGTVGQSFWPGSGPGPFTINPNAVMGNGPKSRRQSINTYRSSEQGTWILGPMKPHEADMTLVSGLHTDLASDADDHRRAVNSVLTGGIPDQGSIDQTLGAHLQGPAPFHTIYSSLLGEHVKENIADYAGPVHTPAGNVVSPTWNPVTTYNQVFPTGIGDVADPSANDALQSRLAVLGSVGDKLNTVYQQGGVEARRRLETYLESIELIEQQTDGLLDSGGSVDVTVDVPQDWQDINPNNKYWRNSANFAPLGKIMMDTTIAALALDRTRVATMHWSASGDSKGPADGKHYTTLNLDLEGDDVQDHALGHFNEEIRRRNQCRIFRWYYEQLAYFVDRLKSIPDGDGTLFDSTAIVVCSEFGGYDHNYNDVPFVLIGSAGGIFKTGQYIDVHNGNFRSYGDALLAVANGLGMNLGSLGNATQPVNAILA